MATFDYPFAEPPSLKALEASYAGNDVEREIKALTIALFIKYISEQAYDVNVAGAAHLGSFDLVRRTVNQDGLTLLQGDREEASMRYLYRAWRSRDLNGRGMHFLRTYLQMSFPNMCKVAQMWQDSNAEYPKSLHCELDDDGTYVIDPETQWLTSRIAIVLDLSTEARSVLMLTNVIRSILPARLVPTFRFWIKAEFNVPSSMEFVSLAMRKRSNVDLSWCGRYITEKPGMLWHLGRSDDPENAPRLGACRFVGGISNSIKGSLEYIDLPRLGEREGRKLDGTWVIPSYGRMTMSGGIRCIPSVTEIGIHASAELEAVKNGIGSEFAYKAPKLLNGSHSLDGSWTLCSALMLSSASMATVSDEYDYIDMPRLDGSRNIDGTWGIPAKSRLSLEMVE